MKACSLALLALSSLALDSCATGELVELGRFRAGMEIQEPRALRVRAVYRGSQGCLPCPSENGVAPPCEPCVPVLLLSETAESPDNEILWIVGREENLVVGRPYIFLLQVRPGYEKSLSQHGNNPLYWEGPPSVEVTGVR